VGARFSSHVQTGLRAHPASCTMGTGSFPGVNRWVVGMYTNVKCTGSDIIESTYRN
jgi:hypothetical protein